MTGVRVLLVFHSTSPPPTEEDFVFARSALPSSLSGCRFERTDWEDLRRRRETKITCWLKLKKYLRHFTGQRHLGRILQHKQKVIWDECLGDHEIDLFHILWKKETENSPLITLTTGLDFPWCNSVQRIVHMRSKELFRLYCACFPLGKILHF